MSTVVVAGALANKPRNGGEAWVRLSWVRGLQQLGADVYFLEEIDARTCVDATGDPADVDDSVNLEYFRDVLAGFGMQERATLLAGDGRSYGLPARDLERLADDAVLLVNISGHLRTPTLLKRFERRAYVDIDPGYTQLWHARGESGLGLEDHDLHFTIGENIGTPGCDIPTGGIDWLPTRQPVVLADWPVTTCPQPDLLTTVASWRGPYGPIEHRGRVCGVKAHEFRRYVELPGHVSQQLELALDIHPADDGDRRDLVEHGWRVVDPTRVAGDPDRFRRYLQGSGGEFSTAQEVYTATGSGWFSDRTARYLASGRPALVQETGFSRQLPTGTGLVSFSDFHEAISGAASITSHYTEHSEAARDVAERFFDATTVLPPLLERAGVQL
jgi:hypothetical protein